jgi:Ser/Thr protein kinase RdoA (MazF antagonist)
MTDAAVQTVLSYYALGPAAVRHSEPLANAGGWSGSRLWRITDTAGRIMCLRRWPAEHPAPDRLRLIHAVLQNVQFGLPVVACPLPTTAQTTFVEHAGHLWELTAWLPGIADYHSHPSQPRLRAAMRVLAQFHNLAARYKRREGPAPAVIERVRHLEGAKSRGLSLLQQSLTPPLGNEIDSLANRLIAAAQRCLASSSAAERLSQTPDLPLQPAIRDIHHDHLLFTGETVSGLIDFGALRIDTPLTDIARLVGSLVGDDDESRQFALSTYSELRPLSPFDRALIHALDESGLIIATLNWLTWLYLERRDMGPTQPIARRLTHILERLESRCR